MLEPNIFFQAKKFLVITLGFFYFPLFYAHLIRDVTAGGLIAVPQGGFIALLHAWKIVGRKYLKISKVATTLYFM